MVSAKSFGYCCKVYNLLLSGKKVFYGKPGSQNLYIYAAFSNSLSYCGGTRANASINLKVLFKIFINNKIV